MLMIFWLLIGVTSLSILELPMLILDSFDVFNININIKIKYSIIIFNLLFFKIIRNINTLELSFSI